MLAEDMQMEIGPKTPTGARTSQPDPSRDAALHDAARALEASFLSEMLKSAGFGKSRDSFGGGAGEDQFSSFLVTAQADEMVKTGGIGLSERLFDVLKARADDAV